MPKPDPITAAARALGARGGAARTPAKAAAARANGAKGGRPRRDSAILTADRAGAPNIQRQAGRWMVEEGGTWRRTTLRTLVDRYGDAWPALRADEARKAAAKVDRAMIRKRRAGRGWVQGGGVRP
jgi:hypothetical protein